MEQVFNQAKVLLQDAISDGPQCSIQMPSCGYIDLESSRNSENHESRKQILHERFVRKVFSSEKNLPNVSNQKRKPVKYGSSNISQTSNEHDRGQLGAKAFSKGREKKMVNQA